VVAFYYRHGQSGVPFHDAVKEFELRQDEIPAGQRQLAGSVYDSRVPPGTTPGKLCLLQTNKYRKTQTIELRIKYSGDEQMIMKRKIRE